MNKTLSDEALDVLFRKARTYSAWLNKPVDDALLKQAYEFARPSKLYPRAPRLNFEEACQIA